MAEHKAEAKVADTKAEKPEVDPQGETPQSSSDLDKEPTKKDAAEADPVEGPIIVANHDEGQQHEVIESITTQAPRVTRSK